MLSVLTGALSRWTQHNFLKHIMWRSVFFVFWGHFFYIYIIFLIAEWNTILCSKNVCLVPTHRHLQEMGPANSVKSVCANALPKLALCHEMLNHPVQCISWLMTTKTLRSPLSLIWMCIVVKESLLDHYIFGRTFRLIQKCIVLLWKFAL